MSNEAKEGAVPILRFPEFRAAGEWAEGSLGSVCLNIGSGKDKIESEGEYELYGSTGIIGKTNSGSHSGDFILVARVGANAGLLTRATGKFGVTDNTLAITLSDSASIDFTYYKLEKFGLNKLMFGSGQPLITGGQLKALRLHWPKPDEQKKIAACLSSLDETIGAEGEKLEALKAHKRGLMQTLFSAEGESVPKLRFAEFADEGEWDKKTLGDVVKFSSGGTPSKDNPKYWNGEIPWISASSMHSAVISHSNLNITELARKDGAAIVREGVMLLLVRGSMLFKRVPMGITAKEVAFNQDVKALHIDKGIAPYFLLYCLMSAEGLLLAKVSATGIGAGKLDTADLKQFPICMPSSAEQQKIAATLSSLDDLITAQTQMMETLKTHKRGMMQALFPTADNESSQ